MTEGGLLADLVFVGPVLGTDHVGEDGRGELEVDDVGPLVNRSWIGPGAIQPEVATELRPWVDQHINVVQLSLQRQGYEQDDLEAHL